MRALTITLLTALVLPTLFTGCFTTQDGKSKFTPIPWRTDTMHRRYDRPLAKVLAAVRESLSTLGTLTSEEKTENVITGRIDTRYVWIKVTADPQSPDSISAVTYQVRTKYRNTDLQTPATLAEQTTLALNRAENPPPTPGA